MHKKRIFHLLICGDFNHPEIDWLEETTPESTSNPASMFIECIRDCFLHQHIKKTTHIGKGEIGNTLGLVFTNEEGMVEDVKRNSPLGKSDHMIITFSFRAYTNRPKKTQQNFNDIKLL